MDQPQRAVRVEAGHQQGGGRNGYTHEAVGCPPRTASGHRGYLIISGVIIRFMQMPSHNGQDFFPE